MGEEILWSTDWQRMGSGKKQAVNLFHLGVDFDFIHNYGLKVIAGRAFSANYGAERQAIILNETAVRALGISSPQAAIGVMLTGGQNDMDSLHVTGVIADYHNEGLQKAIQPLVLFPNRNTRAYYSVKVQGDDPAAALAAIKGIWNRQFPSAPYEYFFLDEFFSRQYTENQRFGEVFALFAMLAIGIACFGLLGLSAYNVLQRTKEIGVRKVLGASVPSLVFVLSKNFLVLVAIAFLFAIPLTWLVMNSWLQGFVYRTAVTWWVLAAAGALALFIALLTVGLQATKAAMANPAKNLRTE
jgi:putative ABC transport system permease protein